MICESDDVAGYDIIWPEYQILLENYNDNDSSTDLEIEIRFFSRVSKI